MMRMIFFLMILWKVILEGTGHVSYFTNIIMNICTKGQLDSEWIFKVIVSPKVPTKNFSDFCPSLSGQKSGKILVGILGETMTS